MLADLVADIRFACRLLVRSPGFAAAAVLTLALGIGATTAIFSVVDAVLLRPVPLPEPGRLVMVWETDRDSGTFREPGAWPDLVDFQQRSRRIDRFGAFLADEAILTLGAGEPSRVATVHMTHAFAPLLGLSPLAGRPLGPDDDRAGGPPVVWISERLWARLFQRDPGAIGRTIHIDDRPQTIAGVLPSGADFGLLQILGAADYGRGFADRDARTEVDLWVPLQATERDFPRDTHPLLLVGRLAPGASVDAAQEELAGIAADLERAYPANNARGVFIEPLRRVVFGPVEPPLRVLLAAAALVLLVACVNVANLLLARGTSRVREVAVRAALGAETRRLARQFVVENTVLTLASAALGVALAAAGLRVLILLAPPEIPRLASIGIDGRVLAVAILISVAVGFAFGMLPIWQATRSDILGTLKTGDQRGGTGPDRSVTRSGLVVAEMALAVVLAIGAALLVKSFWNLRQIDPGFDPTGVLKAEFQLPSTRYPVDFRLWPDFKDMHRFNAALLERVSALPGVESAAIAGNHPLDAGFTNSFVVVGREAESQSFPELSIRRVTPGYFRTLRVRLVRGRLIEESDTTGAAPVIAINEASAGRFFPSGDPLGHQIAFWGTRRTIVGVLANEKIHGLTAAAPVAAYVPLAQAPSANGAEALIVRASGDPASLASGVTGAVRAIDPGLAVFGVEPLAHTLSQSIAAERFTMLLLGLFAALAVVLAAIGIHGVLSYTVAQRSREIGIRVALGAHPRRVLMLVAGQGARLAAGGAAIGVCLALASGRILSGLLYGVPPTHAATYVAVLGVLAIVAVLSIWIPARRAVRLDPIAALHRE
ncbi:MAG: ABC transporter permease [Vicinamibacterales bacterium]